MHPDPYVHQLLARDRAELLRADYGPLTAGARERRRLRLPAWARRSSSAARLRSSRA